jgi:predicted ester cyclase
MTEMGTVAEAFFHACESGKGWAGCRDFCHADATFSAEAEALADIRTLEGYTEWMKGLFTPMPDAAYDLRSLGVDEGRKNVSAYGVFRGTHTGEGGPVPPTGRSTVSDYVYVMEFEDGRISRMTKIWDAPHALKELGWA